MYWYAGECVEGDRIVLSTTDPSLIYGATVFTTLRVYGQSLDHPLAHWPQHCDRLRRSLADLDWPEPDWSQLRRGAECLAARYPVLRLAVLADGREWIVGRALPADLEEKQRSGVVGWVAADRRYRRPIAQHKTGNYLSAWLALQNAQRLGAQEAILVDDRGYWLETSTGNLWGYKAGVWYAPPLDEAILPGIARSQLMGWLRSRSVEVFERPWSPDLVVSFEAIAYSNSAIELVPFRQILDGTIVRFLSTAPSIFLPVRQYFQRYIKAI